MKDNGKQRLIKARLHRERSYVRVIWDECLRGKRENIAYLDAKYIPKEFTNPVSTVIYGDKTAIILWEEVPFAVLIESAKIARSYRNTFELLWKTSRD